MRSEELGIRQTNATPSPASQLSILYNKNNLFTTPPRRTIDNSDNLGYIEFVREKTLSFFCEHINTKFGSEK